MLVLFNTGFRIGYVDNVLRTLFFPKGFENEYRYTVGPEAHVHKADLIDLQKEIGERALICFGDRFGEVNGGPSYVFHPIRSGKVVGVEERGGKVFVKVCLEGFVSAENPKKFTEFMYQLAKADQFDLLSLRGGPENTKDGKYAYPSGHDEQIMAQVKCGDDKWWPAVKQLATTQTFESRIVAKPVFARAFFLSGSKVIDYESINSAKMADVDKDREIRVAVDYYFPAQEANALAQAEMRVICPPGAQLVSQSVFRLGMREGRVEVPVVFEPASDKKFFSFDINFSPVADKLGIAAVTGVLSIRANESAGRKLLLALAVFAYVVGSVILASKGNPWMGGAFQAISLVGMLTLVGKKVV